MLNKLSFHASLISTIKCHNVRVKIADAFDFQHPGHAAGEANRDFMFLIELFLKILDVKYQPLIGPFSRALGGNRFLCQSFRQRFLFSRSRRIGVGMNRARRVRPVWGRIFLPVWACFFLPSQGTFCQSQAPLSSLVRVTWPR